MFSERRKRLGDKAGNLSLNCTNQPTVTDPRTEPRSVQRTAVEMYSLEFIALQSINFKLAFRTLARCV